MKGSPKNFFPACKTIPSGAVCVTLQFRQLCNLQKFRRDVFSGLQLAGVRASRALLNESQDTGKVKDPDTSGPPWFTNGNRADETFGRPFVKFRPRAAGEKFMPMFGRSDPNWQIAVALCGQLRGAGILLVLPIHKPLFHKPPFFR